VPGQPLVHQNAPVLRIIFELHDIETAVVCFNKMGLGAATHLPEETAGVDWH